MNLGKLSGRYHICRTFWHSYSLLLITEEDDPEICGWYICRTNLLGNKKLLLDPDWECGWVSIEYGKACKHETRASAFQYLREYLQSIDINIEDLL